MKTLLITTLLSLSFVSTNASAWVANMLYNQDQKLSTEEVLDVQIKDGGIKMPAYMTTAHKNKDGSVDLK